MTITPYSLDEVFHPRSVAILGASRAPQKWGHVVAKQLINGGFPGDIYLINPTAPHILDRPTYPHLQRVPSHVDLPIITTGSQHAVRSLDDCIAHGATGSASGPAGLRAPAGPSRA